MKMKNTLVIGTRGSKLALTQTKSVAALLKKLHSGLSIQIKIIKTTGDKDQSSPFSKFGREGLKGLFVKEIEEALLHGDIDAAVHSCKDVPTDFPRGLEIGCVLKRELPFDALISRTGLKLADLPEGARIGTSSLRRTSQLMLYRKDFCMVDLRGNLDTRLRKLHEENLDAVIVAYAGVKRLGMTERVTQKIPPRVLVPAVGQGALAIEMRKNDKQTKTLFEKLHHDGTCYSVTCERAFLKELEGGCLVPAGAYAAVKNKQLHMEGVLCSLDGMSVIRGNITGAPRDAEKLGRSVGKQILKHGGKEILREIRA